MKLNGRKQKGERKSNLSPASKSRKVRSNLGTKIMEGGMNINGFAGESINNNNADRIQLDKFSILKSCNKPQKIRFKKKKSSFLATEQVFWGRDEGGVFWSQKLFYG